MSSENRAGTVGFIGLGQMGAPMAENILKKGFPLVVYDIDRDKLDRFAALAAAAEAGAIPQMWRAARARSSPWWTRRPRPRRSSSGWAG